MRVFHRSPRCDRIDSCPSIDVGRFFDGFNATVLAYGQVRVSSIPLDVIDPGLKSNSLPIQTGSGKTYTMGSTLGLNQENQDSGIIPRLLQVRARSSGRCEWATCQHQ